MTTYIYKGDYVPLLTYEINSTVKLNNNYYLALEFIEIEESPPNIKWSLLPEYSYPSKEYNSKLGEVDSIILDSDGGNYFCYNINPDSEFYQIQLNYDTGSNSHFPEKKEPVDNKLPEVGDKFEIKIGDQFRFENNENKTYTVKELSSIIDNGIEKLKVTFDRSIAIGTDIDFFLIRRLIHSPSTIIIDQSFPYTNVVNSSSLTPTTDGFIFPEYPIDSIAKNPDKIIRDLIDKKIIE